MFYQLTLKAIVFEKGDRVFCKGWPEIRMEVIGVGMDYVTCKWFTRKGELQMVNFKPEYLMHYAYASLVVINGRNVCLN